MKLREKTLMMILAQKLWELLFAMRFITFSMYIKLTIINNSGYHYSKNWLAAKELMRKQLLPLERSSNLVLISVMKKI